METKKKKKKKTGPGGKRPDAKDPGQQRDHEKNTESSPGESQFPDFGGLPARDLKKNLGCG